MDTNKVRILSRDSFLAMAQAIAVADFLEQKGGAPEITALKTSGDVKLDAPLYEISKKEQEESGLAKPNDGKSFFTKELEEGLLRGQGDIAVHSLKDLPTELPENLEFSCAIMAEQNSDTIVSRKPLPSVTEKQVEELGGMVIATSSLRRISLLNHYFPGAKVVSMRGNLVTRFEKLIASDNLDAMVLATAGLQRLKQFHNYWGKNGSSWQGRLDKETFDRLNRDYQRLDHIFSQKFYYYQCDPEVFLPPVSQGVLGIENHKDYTSEATRLFNPEPALQQRVALERSLLSNIEAGCHIPFGVHTRLKENKGNNYYSMKAYFSRGFNPDTMESSFNFIGTRNFALDDHKKTATFADEIKYGAIPVVFCGLPNPGFASIIEKRGLKMNSLPLIEIVQKEQAETSLQGPYDTAFVLSVNAVKYLPDPIPRAGRWIAVGERTAAFLKEKLSGSSVKIDLPETYNGEAAAELALQDGRPGSKVVWFGAENGNLGGVEILRKNGVEVDIYTGYSTRERKPAADELGAVDLEEKSFWVFTSPSSVRSYFNQGLNRKEHLISVIGDKTAELFFEKGIVPYHIASKSSIDILAQEIIGDYKPEKWKTIEWSL